jgi:hypothetical protein
VDKTGPPPRPGRREKSWSSGKLLDPAFSMYSCLTVLKDGRLGLLYESGDTAGMVFAMFSLERLMSGR